MNSDNVDFGTRITGFRGMNPAFVQKVWAKRRAEQAALTGKPHTVKPPKRPDIAYQLYIAGHEPAAIAEMLGYRTVSGVNKAINNRKFK